MHKRVMALLLSLVLLLSAAMPVTAMAAEGYAGSFVLVAMNANSTIVEPTRIQYKSGQTIQQALADSDIDFVGLENGFVYEINGVSANYLLYTAGVKWAIDPFALSSRVEATNSSMSASGLTKASTLRASSIRPFITNQRGESGMLNTMTV